MKKQGIVVTNIKHAEGTIGVEVKHIKMHLKYKKPMQRKKKYLVQWDAKTKLPINTIVEIQQCAPVSKRKYFKITNIIKEGE